MELTEKSKKVVDEFIEFVKRADEGTEAVRLDYILNSNICVAILINIHGYTI